MFFIGYNLLALLASGAVAQSAYQAYRGVRIKSQLASRATLTEITSSQETPADSIWLQSVHGVHGVFESNRRLLLAGSGLTLSILAAVGTPGAGLLAMPFIGASAASIITDAIRLIRHRERVAVAIIDLSSAAIIVTSGHFVLISLTQCLYHSSRRLLMMTESKVRGHFAAVYTSRPHHVHRITSEGVVDVAYNDVMKNDVIVVAAGQVVPVDGAVIAGEALLDQRMLTGESQPLAKCLGDDVLASTIVVEGYLELRVERTGVETIAEQIEQYLRTTDEFKSMVVARGERIVDLGARPTLAISVAAFALMGLQQALAINYAAFGYHMRTAAPLTILNYLGVASASDVLVKDGRSLELLSQVDTFVFDKTGTLTEEHPEIGRIVVLPGQDPDEILRLAASAEAGQSHPIARAVLEAAEHYQLDLFPIQSAACRLGLGLSVQIDGRRIILGSQRLMEREGLELSEHLRLPGVSPYGASWIYVAIDGQVQGALELMHVERPEAQAMIHALQMRGIEVIIISGDHAGPTQALASKLGIGKYYASVLPHGKAEIIDQLRAEGRSLCFVGDGINDAIALKKADVSVSISGASTVALDTAAVVLMGGRLTQLITLLDLARQMKVDLDRGTFLSIIPGVVCVCGVFVAGMGVAGAMLLYNAAVVTVVGHAMIPWVRGFHKKRAALQGSRKQLEAMVSQSVRQQFPLI